VTTSSQARQWEAVLQLGISEDIRSNVGLLVVLGVRGNLKRLRSDGLRQLPGDPTDQGQKAALRRH